jgi:hypothetical protein
MREWVGSDQSTGMERVAWMFQNCVFRSFNVNAVGRRDVEPCDKRNKDEAAMFVQGVSGNIPLDSAPV